MAPRSKAPKAVKAPIGKGGSKRTPRKTASPNSRPRPGGKRALVRRLYRAIDTKLRQMEARMRSDLDKPDGGTASAADHERDARAIGTLIKSLERIAELESTAAKSTGASDDARALADEADRLRSELAERLQRLCAPREG